MAADEFFSRWSKSKPVTAPQPEQASAPAIDKQSHAATAAESAPPPTLDDVEKLTHESDFSRFVGSDVDETVKRSALKKLFSAPHFNVMDGLDIYIDDYNKFTPLTPAMLASLKHAKSLLNPPETPRRDPLSQDEDLNAQEPSSPAARGDVAASESVPPDGGQQVVSGEDDAAAPAAEQFPSIDTASETASDIDVENKPLPQGGS